MTTYKNKNLLFFVLYLFIIIIIICHSHCPTYVDCSLQAKIKCFPKFQKIIDQILSFYFVHFICSFLTKPKQKTNCQKIDSQFGQKEKMCSRLDRSATEVMIKEKEKVKFVKLNEVIFDDKQIIFESVHLLTTLKGHQLEDYKTPQNWLLICDNKLKLERLLLEKVKMITDRDCLKLIQEGIEFIRKLESIFGEDSYKLEIAAVTHGIKDKERKISIDSFKQTIKNRKQLSEEIEKKLEHWILNLNNINHLLDVSNSFRKPNLIKVIIEQTIKEFDKIKISIAYWMSLILSTNLKIIVCYWDQLNSECLSNVCLACTRFNLLFPKYSINVIKVIAENQAKRVSSKISFLLQTEVKKVISVKQRIKSCQENVDNTSDYFTASTLSDQFKDNLSLNSTNFQNYFQLAVTNNQQVILKLAFSVSDDQSLNTRKKSTNSKTRLTWSKPNLNFSLAQQKAFYYCDSQYWPIFWKIFKQNFISELLLLKPGVMATPMILCPESYQTFLIATFREFLKNIEPPIEVKNEVNDIYHECYYHFVGQQWFKTFSKFNSRKKDWLMLKNDLENMFDKQTTQSINSLVTFIFESNGYKNQLATYLLKVLLNQIINFLSTLNNSKSLDAFVFFFKDIQIISQKLKTLSNDNKINELMEYLLDLVGLSIKKAIYFKTSDCFIEKIISFKISKGGMLKNGFLNSNLINEILEKNFEILAKVGNVQRVKSLKQNMIEIFCKVFVDLSQGYHLGTKIKLSKIFKKVLNDEINKLIDWMDNNFSETCTIQSNQILRKYQNKFNQMSSKNYFSLCNNKINPQNYDHDNFEMSQINKIFYYCFICTSFLK